jgi:hypothetical protein
MIDAINSMMRQSMQSWSVIEKFRKICGKFQYFHASMKYVDIEGYNSAMNAMSGQWWCNECNDGIINES